MTKEESKKVLATRNNAKDVVQPKMKRINVSDAARNEIARQAALLDNYIAGIVVGMGIKGPWGFDMKNKQVIVPDTGESR